MNGWEKGGWNRSSGMHPMRNRLRIDEIAFNAPPVRLRWALFRFDPLSRIPPNSGTAFCFSPSRASIYAAHSMAIGQPRRNTLNYPPTPITTEMAPIAVSLCSVKSNQVSAMKPCVRGFPLAGKLFSSSYSTL